MNTRQEFIDGFGETPQEERNDNHIIEYFISVVRALQYPQNCYFPEHKPLNLKQHYFAKALDSLFQIKDDSLREILAGFIKDELSDRVH